MHDDIVTMDKAFSRFARSLANALGSSRSFVIAVAVIAVWAVSGPFFNFSSTWQLVINTATTIVTFLFVFLLQHTQNMDTKALHVKLDELIVSSKARNDFVHAEQKEEAVIEELDHLHEALDKEGEDVV